MVEIFIFFATVAASGIAAIDVAFCLAVGVAAGVAAAVPSFAAISWLPSTHHRDFMCQC